MPRHAEYTDSEFGPVCEVVACLDEAFAFFDEHWHCITHLEQIIERDEAMAVDPRITPQLAASGMWEHLTYRR